jgi:hypothetical protein
MTKLPKMCHPATILKYFSSSSLPPSKPHRPHAHYLAGDAQRARLRARPSFGFFKDKKDVTAVDTAEMPRSARPSFGFCKDKKDVAADDTAVMPWSSHGQMTAYPAAGDGSSVSCRDFAYNK